MGTYGSRSLAVGGSAIAKACDKIIEKGKKVAAHMLEGKPEDIDFKDGDFILKNSKQKENYWGNSFCLLLTRTIW